MSKEHIFNILKMIAEMVGATFGEDCEVVIHDLSTREIIYSVNTHVTKRKLGTVIPDSAYKYLIESAEKNKKLIGYPSISRYKNKRIKSSTLILPDEEGKPLASFCVNLDVENLTNAMEAIERILKTTSIADSNSETTITSVTDYASNIIEEVLQKVGKPLPKSKESKMKVLQELHKQDIFLVRDVIPEVCEALEISQATLYNYLRELKLSE